MAGMIEFLSSYLGSESPRFARRIERGKIDDDSIVLCLQLLQQQVQEDGRSAILWRREVP